MLVMILPFLAPSDLHDLPFKIQPSYMKTSLAIAGVLFFMSMWLWLALKTEGIKIVNDRVYYPIVFFIVWCFVTLLWIEDGYLATVMLTQFTIMALVFFLTVNFINSKDKVILLLNAITVSLTLVSLIGLLQYYFIDVDAIQRLFTQIAKPAATFGNKNMASHFIVMTLPISVMLMLIAKNTYRITLYSLSTMVASWFLMYTMARQAYVAIAIETLLLLLFFTLDRWKNKKKSLLTLIDLKKNKLIAVMSISIFLIFAANFNNQGFNIDNNQNSKIAKIQSISIDGNNPRIPAWRNTFEMIKEHPFTGVGIGQWQVKYPLYYDRIMKDIIFNEKTRLRRLHNDYLEMYANVGLVGFLFLFWLAWLVIIKIFKILSDHNNEYRVYVLGLTLGMVGFMTVALFSFPIRVFFPAFILFIFIGVIFAINPKERVFIRIKKQYLFTIFLMVFIVAIFSTWKSFNWVFARHLNVVSAQLQVYNENDLALQKGLHSLSLNTKSPEYFYTTARAFHKLGEFSHAIQYYKKSIDISPFDTLVLLDLAVAYKDSKDKDMERKILEFILRFDSKNVLASARLTVNLSDSQMFRESTIVYKQMKTNFEYFKDRENFGPYHHDLAKTARFVRDYKYMEYVYKDLVRQFPIAENYTKLAATQFYFLDKKELGIHHYKKALGLNPKVTDYKEIKMLIEKYESSTE
jgi:O-antigen ligase